MLLGYDVGSSSIKATLMNPSTGDVLASATHPKQEMRIASSKKGWAEQDPETWWDNIKIATGELLARTRIPKENIKAIGISYQMHGLVVVNKDREVLRPSIIWCDSRAVEIGNKAFEKLGEEYCLSNLLNSPGNFTASKLKWVKDHEPEVFEKIHKIMLPGDFIAMKMTDQINTTISGLSEGIMWNFKKKKAEEKLLKHYGIEEALLPEILPSFSDQGTLTSRAAEELGLQAGTKISYRAGDQPNNAFSLNVLNGGEIAATAGTSGVVYGIIESAEYDPKSRVNTFVHVNYSDSEERYGVLLCVNGTGILNSWLQKNLGEEDLSYEQMNEYAGYAPIGSDGLVFLPFGNGAERILENNDINAQVHGLNFNRHDQRHLLRAGQEGIVFALHYGLEIMKGMGMEVNTVRAGHANMFLSPIFREAFTNLTGATVELYNTDGSQGAARGAGVGAGIYGNFKEAFTGLKTIDLIEPNPSLFGAYEDAYSNWLKILDKQI
jgi:xylulokinase